MFVETIKSKGKSGKVYEPVLVRESFRTPQGPRSRTVAIISGLPPHTRKIIADSFKGLQLVSPLSASLKHAPDYGGLAVLRDAWSRFGLPDLFVDIPATSAARLQAIAFAGGMSGKINLKAISEAGLSYVTPLSNSTLDSLISNHGILAGEVAQMELGDQPQLIEIEHEGRRYVLAGGAWRAQRHGERRAARLIKGEAVLIRLAAAKRKKSGSAKAGLHRWARAGPGQSAQIFHCN